MRVNDVGAHRARVAQLPAVRHLQRQAGRGHRRLPDPGVERPRRRRPTSARRWPIWPSGSRRASTTSSRSTRPRPVKAGIREIVETLLEAIGLVVLVVFVFLQSWRATLIPLLTVPVSLIGAFAVFPAARLLGQHALALRPRPGDRPRRRRRDRRRRGGGAPHRGGDGAARRDAPGDVARCRARSSPSRSSWPRCSSRSPSWAASRAGSTSSSRSPSPISVLISAFNALTLSPALERAAPAPAPGTCAGRSARLGGGFNRWFGQATDGYIGVKPLPVAQGRHSARAARRRRRGRRCCWAASCRRASSPTRTKATRSSACSSPTARRCSARARSTRRSTPSSPSSRASDVQRHRRLQLLHAHGGELHGHRLRSVQRPGTSARRRAVARPHRREPQHGVLADPRGARLRRRAAGHPGHQRRGRLQHDAAGPERRNSTSSSPRTSGASSPRRASARSSRACGPTSRPPCRSSSPTSTRTRR